MKTMKRTLTALQFAAFGLSVTGSWLCFASGELGWSLLVGCAVSAVLGTILVLDD